MTFRAQPTASNHTHIWSGHVREAGGSQRSLISPTRLLALLARVSLRPSARMWCRDAPDSPPSISKVLHFGSQNLSGEEDFLDEMNALTVLFYSTPDLYPLHHIFMVVWSTSVIDLRENLYFASSHKCENSSNSPGYLQLSSQNLSVLFFRKNWRLEHARYQDRDGNNCANTVHCQEPIEPSS